MFFGPSVKILALPPYVKFIEVLQDNLKTTFLLYLLKCYIFNPPSGAADLSGSAITFRFTPLPFRITGIPSPQ